MSLTGLLVNWTWLRRDSLSQRIFQQKPQNLKSKGDIELKKQNKIPGTMDNYKVCNICVMGLPGGKEREKGREEIFVTVKIKNFPQINARHYIQTLLYIAENTKEDKCQNLHLGILPSTTENNDTGKKKKSSKKPRRKTYYLQRNKNQNSIQLCLQQEDSTVKCFKS